MFSGKGRSFPENLRVQSPSTITKQQFSGIIFGILSCQTVVESWTALTKDLLSGCSRGDAAVHLLILATPSPRKKACWVLCDGRAIGSCVDAASPERRDYHTFPCRPSLASPLQSDYLIAFLASSVSMSSIVLPYIYMCVCVCLVSGSYTNWVALLSGSCAMYANGTDCDPSRHLQESPNPPGPKSQKSLEEGLLGGLQKRPQKYPKKSENTNFRTFLGIFWLFRVFFGTFLQTPRRPFSRLFCDFGPGGPGDSCKWRPGSQGTDALWPVSATPILSCRDCGLRKSLDRKGSALTVRVFESQRDVKGSQSQRTDLSQIFWRARTQSRIHEVLQNLLSNHIMSAVIVAASPDFLVAVPPKPWNDIYIYIYIH